MKNSWFGRTFFDRGSAEASVRFGSVFDLVRFGSAEPVKARFGRTLAKMTNLSKSAGLNCPKPT